MIPMDTADREPGHGHGHGHRIETSLLPLKKRASNCRISVGNLYPSSPSKKKRMANSIVVGAETKDTTGALEAPLLHQQRLVPDATSREPALGLPAPAAASPEPAAKDNALSESDEEKKRLSKGKWLAREESSSLVTPQPPVKKLMHDGIRSFIPQQLRDDHRHAAAAAEADDAVPLPLPLPLHGSPALSSALKRRLAELGATRLWLVHSKTLHKSDVDENQNRLLVSCKRGSGTEDCPITRCFSPAELERVNKKHAGLVVTALDRDGVPYALTCKFLESNNGYRFISEWKDFLTQNGMNLNSQKHKLWTRDVEVELWAFRSRQLPFQPQIDAEGKVVTLTTKDEDGKKVTVVQRVSHHLDPDGALGLLLLHHENRRGVKREEEEENAADDDWKGPPSVARNKGKQQSGKRDASASASASASVSPVALPAPAAEQGGARRSEATFYAAVGLAKLRQAIWDRWQEHANKGQGAKGFSNDVAKSSADVEGEKIDKKNKK